MNELQGAIGLAQLRKLNYIIKSQRKIYNSIWDSIKKIKGIKKENILRNVTFQLMLNYSC